MGIPGNLDRGNFERRREEGGGRREKGEERREKREERREKGEKEAVRENRW